MLLHGKSFGFLAVFSIFISTVSIPSLAARGYTCRNTLSTSITTQQEYHIFGKEKLTAEADNNIKNPITVKLIFNGKETVIQGNNGSSKLYQFNTEAPEKQQYYFEPTHSGNTFLWVFYSKKMFHSHKAYLIQLKAYALDTPVSYTNLYECILNN